jgi:glutamyl-tRNA synthetase
MNSNFEEWYLNNLDKEYSEFKFSFDKMSKSGPIFDLDKLINISKNFLSRISAGEVYNRLLEWSKEYDLDFYNLIEKEKEYTINILNIEREKKNPRKDFASYSEIKDYIWYMYDELFYLKDLSYDGLEKYSMSDVILVLNTYFNEYYSESDDKDTWFNKMKEAAESLGYISNMKEYKNNPNKYKGSIGDFSMIIRVCVTSKSMTPDLYDILRLLGIEKINKRIDKIKGM